MAITADMPTASAHGIEGLTALTDKIVGPTEWREVTQDLVNRFAEITGDHQWIHVDIERAKRESPYGTTIAHGNLTLSMIDGMREKLNDWSGFALGVNYGWNKVRFPSPVIVGSKIRCYAQLVEVSEVGSGWYQVVTRFTVEADGVEKPVCVADSVGRVLIAQAD